MTAIRLGLHRMSSREDERFRDYVERVRPQFVKFLDPGDADEGLAAWCRARGTEVIGRVYFDPQELGAGAGRQIDFVLEVAKRLPSIRWWELHNEAWQKGDELARYSELSIEFMKRLDQLGGGRKAVIGNFSTGQPEIEEWRRFEPALRHAAAHGHPLGVHEYSAPLMWYGTGNYQFNGGSPRLGAAPAVKPAGLGWWTLRHRRALLQLDHLGIPRPRILITEAGIDDIQPRPAPHEGKKGWRDYADVHWTTQFGDYARQLAWYCRELAASPEVIGAVDFGWAAIDPQWSSFDLAEEPAMVERVIAEMRTLPAGPKPPAPTPPKEPPMPPTSGTYTVARGDTLFKLGTRFGVPWIVIADANSIRRPYVLEVGRQLVIPGIVAPPQAGGYKVVNGPYTKHRWPRPQGSPVTWIVVHSPAAGAQSTVAGTLAFLRSNADGVSYHSLVVAGKVHILAGVDEWVGHAGSNGTATRPPSRIPGTNVTSRAVNFRTVGVSLYDGPSVKPAVMETGARYVADLIRQLGLPDAGIVLSHAEVDPSRRHDPVGVSMTEFRALVHEHLSR